MSMQWRDTLFKHSTKSKDGLVVESSSPGTWIDINVNKDSEKASMKFSDGLAILDRITDPEVLKVVHSDWDRVYQRDDGTGYYLLVSTEKQIMNWQLHTLDGFMKEHTLYPTRYLTCQSLAQLRQDQEAAIASQLIRTILIGVIQSYTSYSRTSFYGSYGGFNYTGFGYTTDYSWAGDRAADALGAIFGGNSSLEKIDEAWKELKCF